MKAFVLVRDRLTYAKQCVSALRFAGLDVVIVDQGSTWLPTVGWMNTCGGHGVQVLHRGSGHHPRELWGWEPFQAACGSDRYVVTDPDVIPDPDCPDDWVAHLGALLDEHGTAKAGLSLRTDDLPDHYPRRQQVIDWEKQFQQNPLPSGDYRALIDTTLAMYQPLTEVGSFTMDSIRTGAPYLARHLAWYENPADMLPEVRYYYDHAEPGISFWTVGGASAWGNLSSCVHQFTTTIICI